MAEPGSSDSLEEGVRASEIYVNEPVPERSPIQKVEDQEFLERLIKTDKLAKEEAERMKAAGLDPNTNSRIVDGLGLVPDTAWTRAEGGLAFKEQTEEDKLVEEEAKRMRAEGLDPNSNTRIVDGLGLRPDTAWTRVRQRRDAEKVMKAFKLLTDSGEKK